MSTDFHDDPVTVSYVFCDEEIAVSIDSRSLPRVGDFVEIGLTIFRVGSIIHRISQYEPNIRVFLGEPSTL